MLFGAAHVANVFVTGHLLAAAVQADFTPGWTWALPMLVVLPNALFGLFLLRKVRNHTRLSTD